VVSEWGGALKGFSGILVVGVVSGDVGKEGVREGEGGHG
jgi:hypothetical protein